MSWRQGVETVVALEKVEELLPLLSKTVGDVVPEALYPGVMYASGGMSWECQRLGRTGARNQLAVPRYKTHDQLP